MFNTFSDTTRIFRQFMIFRVNVIHVCITNLYVCILGHLYFTYDTYVRRNSTSFAY